MAPTKGWLGWGDGLTVSPYASTTPAALQAAAKALIMQVAWRGRGLAQEPAGQSNSHLST